MTGRWTDYFHKDSEKYHSLLECAVNHWNYNDPLYFRIRNLIKPGARILDVGCGPGLSDIYLQACGYKVTGLEKDPEVLAQAKENASYFKTPARFESGDAFDLSGYHNSFDLAYSVGVVEHFDRPTTVRLIREQARCASSVITVIPTKYTSYSGQITDERIYTVSQLNGIMRDAGLNVVSQFGYGNITSPVHNLVRRLLPHGALRVLQDRCSYAMGIACIGRKDQ